MASAPESIATRPHGCPECGHPAERKSAKGPPPIFCSNECKRAMEARKLADGRAFVIYAKAWRLSRNNKANAQLGAACLSAMSAIIDLQNERDRKGGISTEMTLGYAERLLAGDPYFDLSNNARWKKERDAKAS